MMAMIGLRLPSKETLNRRWHGVMAKVVHMSGRQLLAFLLLLGLGVVFFAVLKISNLVWSPRATFLLSTISWILGLAGAFGALLGLLANRYAHKFKIETHVAVFNALIFFGTILAFLSKLIQPTPAPPAADLEKLKFAISNTDQASLDISPEVTEIAKQLELSHPDPLKEAEGRMALKDFPAAIEVLDKGISTANRGLADAHFYKARALWALGQYDQAAMEATASLGFRPKFSPALVIDCASLKQLRRLNDALAACSAAVAADKTNPGAWNSRANVLMALGQYEGESGEKRYEEALADLNVGIQLRPQIPQTWNDKAIALHHLHQDPEALSASDEALRLAPNFADALLNRGTILKSLRRLPEAMEAYKHLTAQNPSDAEAWNNLGDAAESNGNLPEALEAYNTALQVKPEYADALYNKGEVLNKLGRSEEAIPILQRELEFMPNDADSLYQLALAFKGTGNTPGEVDSVNRLLKVDPRNRAGLNLREEVRRTPVLRSSVKAAKGSLAAKGHP